MICLLTQYFPEMGNAVSAMFKRGRITLTQERAIIEGFQQLPIHRFNSSR